MSLFQQNLNSGRTILLGSLNLYRCDEKYQFYLSSKSVCPQRSKKIKKKSGPLISRQKADHKELSSELNVRFQQFVAKQRLCLSGQAWKKAI